MSQCELTSLLAQSTSCCSERLTSSPVLIWWAASRAPVAEKVQQEPHWPWSFTGVTAPSSLQSQLSGAEAKLAEGRKSDPLHWKVATLVSLFLLDPLCLTVWLAHLFIPAGFESVHFGDKLVSAEVAELIHGKLESVNSLNIK